MTHDNVKWQAAETERETIYYFKRDSLFALGSNTLQATQQLFIIESV